MSEKNYAEMKWNEIPDETPMYEVLQYIGFPEPMIILKHLNKESKKGKKPDLSGIISFLWLPKGDIQELLEDLYHKATRNTEVRQYLVEHPEHAIMLIKTYKQIKEEPLAVVAERNLNEWRKLLIEEGMWDNLMKETPLTLIDRVMKMITETDYLNMTLGEYFANFEVEAALEGASIKAMADKLVEAEEKERRMKQLEAELKAAGFGSFESMLRMAMSGRTKDFKIPGMNDDTGKSTS